MTWIDTVMTALRGLLSNKLRAALSMLGVIIGVASVIAMLALGNGARAAVESSFRALGSDTVQIQVKEKFEQGSLVPVGKKLLIDDGLQMVKHVELVDRVDMSLSKKVKVRHARHVLDINASAVTAHGLMTAVQRNKLQPRGWPDGKALAAGDFLAQGRFFSQSEVLTEADVCVLGHKTAADLFEGENAVDSYILVGRRRCLVIGVLTELEFNDPQKRGRANPNQLLFMPISTGVRHLFEEEPSVLITAHVQDESRMLQARVQIMAFLRQRHQVRQDKSGVYQDDFKLVTRQDILGAQQASARTFSLLLATMAAVSLVVGGIGVMNVMLTSVSERTREIGIRMAIGATMRDIVAQFLLEAVLISIVGGLIGVALGILAIPVAASLNEGVALLAPNSIPLSLAVSILTGVTFGLYPAIRAARLDPIEALRYE